MNEFLYILGWVLKGIEFLIVIFWLRKFSRMRWKLFFGVKKDLASVQHHELYSCFLSSFCFLTFHLIGSEVDQFILSLEMDKLEQIKLFYTSGVIVQFSFAMTLMCSHLIRGCTFSPTARICMYTTLVYMMLQGMELISRAYYDYHNLGLIYQVGVWICNFIAVGALCTYPIRSLKDYFQQRRAATE
ncbi:hypothetical protein HG263_05740 [Pseudoalteromonas sp. JBTF-M23]|uniref:Uncharacterized protein n=1 Tax=Pseudoalteromonas caenipelagi TaxID=2726988 RepID=A0A849V8Z0_9GAMM|nr:hypothetical protein [Pseudoalteromonas caenipelagi]NOU50039.1 hypothetical protein [Pseudoalteromonas caenipelagi]